MRWEKGAILISIGRKVWVQGAVTKNGVSFCLYQPNGGGMRRTPLNVLIECAVRMCSGCQRMRPQSYPLSFPANAGGLCCFQQGGRMMWREGSKVKFYLPCSPHHYLLSVYFDLQQAFGCDKTKRRSYNSCGKHGILVAPLTPIFTCGLHPIKPTIPPPGSAHSPPRPHQFIFVGNTEESAGLISLKSSALSKTAPVSLKWH